MKNSILLLIIICMISCTSNTIFKKPEDLIPKDSMALLLSDLYLATSSKVYRNKFDERNIDYTFLVFEKYGIDSARFRRSNHYYTTKIDEYEKIYKEVESKLQVLNKDFKGLKKIQDSIRRDSIKTVKKKRDSLKKVNKAKTKTYDSLMRITSADSLSVEELLIEMDSLNVPKDNTIEKNISKK